MNRDYRLRQMRRLDVSTYPEWIKELVAAMHGEIESLEARAALDSFWTEAEIKAAVIRKLETVLARLKHNPEAWTISKRRYSETDERLELEISLLLNPDLAETAALDGPPAEQDLAGVEVGSQDGPGFR